ncbi:F-box/WD repeat-containing protein 4 isoform X3 [Falco biarmicus]|uniref:F-box/WD repeat-containing protein 4 isoform X3 n=1 Tax=Falco rusticolus TaxID=120794 RepID=UPI00188680C6|nr:F-box/WD repeat-containing protein 4 isoform X3 [Falco rusticolus]XP_055575797.1 F-box/WD repeat-containing protein 4 isoform X3 [Falco cherrug]XP_055651509.1 F-box/WD repeat-containing protein 4 isoform X3 [Falco peregrinus]XP_056207042.1 F-box/WD repeat-containing protein 4 isoform X3 [Falco biarmicus]
MGRKGSPRSPQAEGGSRAASPPSPLWALPEELLLLICSYLDAQALGRLGQVCRRLRFLSSRDLLWRRIARGCLNSGFTQLGTDLLMPWLELDGEYLYLSQAENIQAYRLCAGSTGLQCHPQAIFSGHQEDVCRFVLVNSHIVSGGGDGNIVLHKIRGSYSAKFSAHEQEVNCVDFQGGLIVSGSRDRTAKVWSLSAGRVGQCLHTVQTEDRVWSIAISPLLSSFVTGTACCGHTSPLRIWDLESSQLLTCLGTDFHRGAGVLDVFYETPSLLLSCGYDTYIRYWDIRTSTRKCVQEWEEPHDSALYCIRSDKNHMIASGSSYYGVVRLWDKRQTQCLQSFHLSSPTSSPVYCLRFSTTHLYAALASALHVLDFTAP